MVKSSSLGKNRFKSEVGILTRLIEDNIYSRSNINSVLSENGKLLKNDLIAVSKGMARYGSTTNISINPDIYTLLVDDTKHTKSTSSLSLIESNSAIQLSTPIKTLKNLILSDKDKKIIISLIKSSSTNTNHTLAEWGFYNLANSQEQTIILLHGLPGIGKTLSAEVIATELNKKLDRKSVV